jgi:hypothetical protein
MNLQRWIEVSLQKEGIHKYPGADTDPKLATGDWDDVSFLGVPHRHIFHFYAKLEVFHNDREVEFIQFKRWLERLFDQGTMQASFKSCEMMAEDMIERIHEKYPGRNIEVRVYEDNENGAILIYDRNQALKVYQA